MPSQPLPIYVRIADRLRRKITSGELQIGDRIPSERTIALDWGVSRPTATSALDVLRLAGLVESAPGRGTVVRSVFDAAQFSLRRDGSVRHDTCGWTYGAPARLDEAYGAARTHTCHPPEGM
jgi:GntR family transcriptional regulator